MNIVCGTDFSVHANDAALAAGALAARGRGALTLVHVIDLSRYRNPSKDLLDHLRDSRQKKLDMLADRARRRAVKVEARVVEGSPAAKLGEVAAETQARLLVVSSAGQISPAKWFVGSVADEVVRLSSIPTVVVRDAVAFKDWAYAKRPLRVLVGYDFSASAEGALRWVDSLGEIVPYEVTVAYIASAANERTRLDVAPPMSPLYYPSGIKKFLEYELKQKCDSVLGEDRARSLVKADWGRPDSQLIEIAAEDRADLIVVGTSQRRGLARLGSVSRAVLHYAHMSVACVPGAVADSVAPVSLPGFKRVLVPIDFSEPTERVIALACASVRGYGEVRLIHVIPPAKRNATLPPRNGRPSKGCQDVLAHMLALIPRTGKDAGIAIRSEVVEHGEPATAICQAAERMDADFICMGTRGRSRFKETLFGSVTQQVMGQSKRPVLVIRGTAQRRGAGRRSSGVLRGGA